MKSLIKKYVYSALTRSARISIWGWHLGAIQTTNESHIQEFSKKLTAAYFRTSLVRIGGEGDGGYLVPDEFENIKACFSPGVGDTFHFESELSKKGIPSFLADGTIRDIKNHDPLIKFLRKNLSSRSGENEISLQKWVESCVPKQGDLILQMDIEGAEYSVLTVSDSDLLRRFRIIVIEFHNLDRLWDSEMFSIIDAIFEKLIEYFNIVHVHPNNSRAPLRRGRFSSHPVVEVTFLRKDFCIGPRETILMPHPLDQLNKKNLKLSHAPGDIFQPI
jgi:hypothetical protein